ncbi:hypothetical protein JTB14_006571 [Gonioctena quinquepunctata]|nr:hypothetical protein JTB14_006571 [Gonioctena quinquepunctata]
MGNNVKFVLLRPNSTHLCQPLDLAFLSPLKNSWRKVLHDRKMERKGPIHRDYFSVLLKQTLDNINNIILDNMMAESAASGLYALDVNRVLTRLPEEPEENGFVVVNYVYDKGSKRDTVKVHMGKIISATSDRKLFAIRFMRNYKVDIYHFPEIDDVDDATSPWMRSRGLLSQSTFIAIVTNSCWIEDP